MISNIKDSVNLRSFINTSSVLPQISKSSNNENIHIINNQRKTKDQINKCLTSSTNSDLLSNYL